jgi:CheY-like chemotaxis protein
MVPVANRLGEPIDILLVEDNPGDVRLTFEALQEAKVCNELHVVNDGAEALAYLAATTGEAERATPDLILLDLNLPKIGGIEVLRRLKADPQLKHIPVVVLTTSSAEQDIVMSYGLHANSYIVKPVDLEQFLAVVHAIEDFWLTVVTLPRFPANDG